MRVWILPVARYVQRISLKPFSSLATDPQIIEALRKGKPFIGTQPEFFNVARDVIDVWANEYKTHPASVPAFWFSGGPDGPETKYTYHDLSNLSQKVAGMFLSTLGLKQFNDRILICIPRMPQYWLIALGCHRTGIELSPTTMLLTSKDLCGRMKKFEPTTVITVPRKVKDVEEAIQHHSGHRIAHKILIADESQTQQIGNNWKSYETLLKKAPSHDGNQTRSTDPCLIFFTSGTTGDPKMVEQTQAYALGHMISASYMYNMKRDDIFWCMADTGWVKVFWGTFASWTWGACTFVDGEPKFDAAQVLKLLRTFPVTKICAPPTAYRMMVTHRDKELFKFKSLSDCVSAGEPLNPETYTEWLGLSNLKIREGYGQSETAVLCATPIGMKIKPGSMGRPAPGTKVVILDDNLQECPHGTVGHLAISTLPRKPVGMFVQYRNNPEKTNEAFHDNFYFTGDKAAMDDDGYVWFNSRADDVITSSGYRIGPYEVESALIEHEAVVESAAVGSPDPKRFEIVTAYVVLHEGFKNKNKEALTKELQEFVKRRTAPYKYPRKIVFIDALPKTASGKIQRRILKDREYKREK